MLAAWRGPGDQLRLWEGPAATGGSPWLTPAAGAAMAVTFVYALIFLPCADRSDRHAFARPRIAALSPALALIAGVNLPAASSARRARPAARLAGVLAGLVALILVDLPATATYVAVGGRRRIGQGRARRGADAHRRR